MMVTSKSAFVKPKPFQLFQRHKESLDRLYEWDKKLYEEIKAEERVRLWYDKKCMHLRSHDANSAEPFAFKTTRAAIRTSGPSSASPSPPSTLCPGGLSPSATTSCCLLP